MLIVTLCLQSPSASTIRRHVIASLVQRYRSVGKNACALPPASPGYNNSVEVSIFLYSETFTCSISHSPCSKLLEFGLSLMHTKSASKVMTAPTYKVMLVPYFIRGDAL